MPVILWVLQANHLPKGQGVKESEMGIEIVGQCSANRIIHAPRN
jgi:hypothetical protein